VIKLFPFHDSKHPKGPAGLKKHEVIRYRSGAVRTRQLTIHELFFASIINRYTIIKMLPLFSKFAMRKISAAITPAGV
jgi:hypothetical protein